MHVHVTIIIKEEEVMKLEEEETSQELWDEWDTVFMYEVLNKN